MTTCVQNCTTTCSDNSTPPAPPPSGGDQNATNCTTICYPVCEIVCINGYNVSKCSNVCNTTCVPVVIPPSGGGNQTVENCTFYKVCRERSQCGKDKDYWEYWGKKGCSCDKASKPVHKRRICNATDDSEFSADQFLSNSSYYEGCDCAVFENCTTVIIPIPPIVVPPLPPSGDSCNYTCDDIRGIHIALLSLSDLVTSQQNDIDMLIGMNQDLTQRVTELEGNWTASGNRLDAFDSDIQALYD